MHFSISQIRSFLKWRELAIEVDNIKEELVSYPVDEVEGEEAQMRHGCCINESGLYSSTLN